MKRAEPIMISLTGLKTKKIGGKIATILHKTTKAGIINIKRGLCQTSSTTKIVATIGKIKNAL